MTGKDTNQISRRHWYSLGLQRTNQIIVWISIIVVIVLTILDLIGWVFSITIFKSFGSKWMPMKPIAAICFILSITVLLLIEPRTKTLLKNWISRALSVIIFVISLSAVIIHLRDITQGNGSSIAGIPLLSPFLSPLSRMPFLTALIFLFIGCVLLLLSIEKKMASDIAHFLIFPAALASYFVPVSYILDVKTMTELPEIPVPLNTGIAFCALCLAVLCIRPETWLMKVFSSHNMGGMMARRLLPGLLLLPVLIGWFRIKGERLGIFESEIGVVLVALAYTVCFIWFVWIAARSINRIDEKRHISDEALKRSYVELDLKIKERTDELKTLNVELEQKVKERTHDLESANVQLNQELTARILTEEALKKSETQLKELNATKDKFFNIVAHDLKNPFTSLLGSSELLFRNIDQMDHEKIKTLALILNDASKSGYAILQNLLDWSRSQTGLLKINPERINLRNLIDEDILSLEQFSANKEIEMYSEIEDDMFILADKNMIKTILRNLLSNAIKYSFRSGKVIVGAVLNHDEIIVSIKDTGIGISKENIEKIFRIDAKYSLPGTENEQGTGLGLKLCKEFVEKQGGKIWAESIENKGSEFKFSIPVKEG